LFETSAVTGSGSVLDDYNYGQLHVTINNTLITYCPSACKLHEEEFENSKLLFRKIASHVFLLP
jgi:hypothetical protein